MAFFSASPLRSSVTTALIEAVKHVTPVSTTSRLEEGQLTPEEFVAAGDELCFDHPQKIWHWRAAPSDRAAVNYLPRDKQMLVCDRIPCKQITDALVEETTAGARGDDGFEKLSTRPKSALAPPAAAAAARPPTTVDELMRQDWDVGETDDFDGITQANGGTALADPDTRYYSIYILYDHYYRVPRLYLAGFDGRTRAYLTPEEMRQDIRQEQREVTATLERHPYTGQPCLSIHPCRHAQFMKQRFLELGLAGGHGHTGSAGHGPHGQGHTSGQSTAETTTGAAVDRRIREYLPLLLKVLSAAVPGLQGHDMDGQRGGLVLMNVTSSSANKMEPGRRSRA